MKMPAKIFDFEEFSPIDFRRQRMQTDLMHELSWPRPTDFDKPASFWGLG